MFRLLDQGEKIKLGDEMLFEVPDGPLKGAWRWCAVPASCAGEHVTIATVPIRRKIDEHGEIKILRLANRVQREQMAREQRAMKQCLMILKGRERSWKAGIRAAGKLLKKIESDRKTK